MNAPLPLAEAQARLLNLCQCTGVESTDPENAVSRYLAEPVSANRTQPSARLSAMDGFATSGDGPWRIVGESRCGSPFNAEITPGQAIRISTGAHAPAGADAIVLIEDAEVGPNSLLSSAAAEKTRYFREPGSDFHAGDTLLAGGTKIGPAQLALAKMAMTDKLTVHQRPRIAILECGDELAAGANACEPHQIPATNGAMLKALAKTEQCEIDVGLPLPDKLEAIAAGLAGKSDRDLIVISGGASVGDHDLVRPALEKIGATIDFWRVAMKPGKPLMVAQRGDQLVLGLPGNPVSSFVTGLLFMLPAIRKMLGAHQCIPLPLHIPVASDLSAGGPRTAFARAVWDGAYVHSLESRDSGALAELAKANALIERPAECDAVKAGTYVPVYLLQNGGIA